MTIPDEPILCVDDEPANLALLRRMLQDEHRVTFARSAAEAIALVARETPALMLLDIDMPGMNGIELCKQLKASPETAGFPILFVSGMSDATSERDAFEAGGVDFIGKPLSLASVRARVRAQLALARVPGLEADLDAALEALGAAGHHHGADAGAHVRRMAASARCLAQAVGWSAARARLLELATLPHDLGQIAVPEAILLKAGALDAAEREALERHPRKGHALLAASQRPVLRLAAEVALHHHERWDGSGYPARLAGEQIPESARIVAVADVFDALTRRRPHRARLSAERALAVLDELSGTQLEPRLVSAFRDMLPKVLDLQAFWDAKA